MQNFIVVTTYTYPFEYAVLKTILVDEGIPHVFENETMVQLAPFYSNALGGIKLKVHKTHYTYVRELVTNLDRDPSHLKIV